MLENGTTRWSFNKDVVLGVILSALITIAAGLITWVIHIEQNVAGLREGQTHNKESFVRHDEADKAIEKRVITLEHEVTVLESKK